jgi:hydroxyacylglutathione hydrolase
MPDTALELRKLTVEQWQENCYLIVNPQKSEGLLVDPGDEPAHIKDWIGTLKIRQILLSHAHFDHVGAVNELRSHFDAPVGLHPADWELAAQSGVEADFNLNDGDMLWPSLYKITVVHTPGHTPGSVCLRFDRRALVGDVIFPGGPGHTHSPEELNQSLLSLKNTVFTWPDATELFPGHGISTTVGQERPGFMAFLKKPRSPELFGDVSWKAETK